MSIVVEEIMNMIYNGNISINELIKIIEKNVNSDNINYVDSQRKTLLLLAIYCKYIDVVKLLVDKGADVNINCGSSGIPLTAAIAVGNKDIIEYLINKGANIEGIDFSGRTPFIAAAFGGNINVLTVLMKYGANINANFQGRNALDFAIAFNDLEMVKLLTSVNNFVITENNINGSKNYGNKNIIDLVTAAFNNQKDIKFAGRKV